MKVVDKTDWRQTMDRFVYEKLSLLYQQRSKTCECRKCSSSNIKFIEAIEEKLNDNHKEAIHIEVKQVTQGWPWCLFCLITNISIMQIYVAT